MNLQLILNPQLIILWILVGLGASHYPDPSDIPNPDDDTPPVPPWPGPWPWIKLIGTLGAVLGGFLYNLVFMSEIATTGVEVAATGFGAFVGCLIFSEVATIGLRMRSIQAQKTVTRLTSA